MEVKSLFLDTLLINFKGKQQTEKKHTFLHTVQRVNIFSM